MAEAQKESVRIIGELGCDGVMFTYGLFPGVPLENIKALMDAKEQYAIHFS